MSNYAISMYFNAYTDKALRNVETMNRRLKGTAEAMDAARRHGEHLNAFAAGIGNTGRMLTTRVTLPMTLMGAAFVRSAGQMESWELGFSNMLRSADKGKKLLWELVRLADSTPFVDSTIISGATQLLGTGLDEKKAPDLLMKLADVAAGIGGDNNTLFRLIAGTSKALEKGRLNMEALEPFMTAGAGIIQEMANIRFGGEREVMFKEMERGKVQVDLLYEALERMTGAQGRFYQATKKQSETIPGLWSTLVGKSQTTSARLGAFLVDHYGIKDKMKGVSDWVVGIGVGVEDMSKGKKNLLAATLTTAYLLGPALIGVSAVLKTMMLPLTTKWATESILSLGMVSGKTKTAIEKLNKGSGAILGGAMALGTKIGRAVVAGFGPALVAGVGYWIHKSFSDQYIQFAMGGKSNIDKKAEAEMKKHHALEWHKTKRQHAGFRIEPTERQMLDAVKEARAKGIVIPKSDSEAFYLSGELARQERKQKHDDFVTANIGDLRAARTNPPPVEVSITIEDKTLGGITINEGGARILNVFGRGEQDAAALNGGGQ